MPCDRWENALRIKRLNKYNVIIPSYSRKAANAKKVIFFIVETHRWFHAWLRQLNKILFFFSIISLLWAIFLDFSRKKKLIVNITFNNLNYSWIKKRKKFFIVMKFFHSSKSELQIIIFFVESKCNNHKSHARDLEKIFFSLSTAAWQKSDLN